MGVALVGTRDACANSGLVCALADLKVVTMYKMNSLKNLRFMYLSFIMHQTFAPHKPIPCPVP
jgi:hypothetical protein